MSTTTSHDERLVAMCYEQEACFTNYSMVSLGQHGVRLAFGELLPNDSVVMRRSVLMPLQDLPKLLQQLEACLRQVQELQAMAEARASGSSH